MFSIYNNFILLFLLILFLGLLLNYLLIKNYKKLNLTIFLDSDFKKPQSFHRENILRIGGLSLYIIFVIIFFLMPKSYYDLLENKTVSLEEYTIYVLTKTIYDNSSKSDSYEVYLKNIRERFEKEKVNFYQIANECKN
jgi:UDP-N-acetylmuramyl pentapeptide phosphotransferase/UDP-N-acetylglucosamine-1-phosphate transferase